MLGIDMSLSKGNVPASIPPIVMIGKFDVIATVRRHADVLEDVPDIGPLFYCEYNSSAKRVVSSRPYSSRPGIIMWLE
jgi:hypothetical protein